MGPLVVVAYPERIAQAQGGGGFRLRGGGGGLVPSGDALAASPFLAVARIEPGVRGPVVRLAAHLSAAEVEAAVAGQVEEESVLRWDAEADDVRVRSERRAGALVLASSDRAPAPGPAVTEVLLDRVRATQGGILRWTPGARALQGRLQFLHGLDPGAWPEVSDAGLLATLDEWLGPLLPGAKGRRDLERIDLAHALLARLPYGARRDLDALAPTSFATVDGGNVAIGYESGGPRAEVRVQRLFGLTEHPTAVRGAVPVVLELLSPAGRPIQVTADLPGFWEGSWAEVRKEMAGRYPKHPWPPDPAATPPPARRGRR
ncbi:ATP-dependent helicase C-terminal domain-containing protein [Aquihabitans sp. McL0605]|uniref:ATP-dependent helicase C-terminal domain-containing protein n=1 Tax=Aquihabitans sp. McL0605 TaxID=3415671 RepID=UPI003CEA57C8